jgi:hypothetical protein
MGCIHKIFFLLCWRCRLLMANGRRGLHIGYWWESQEEKDHGEDQDVRRWTILKCILER